MVTLEILSMPMRRNTLAYVFRIFGVFFPPRPERLKINEMQTSCTFHSSTCRRLEQTHLGQMVFSASIQTVIREPLFVCQCSCSQNDEFLAFSSRSQPFRHFAKPRSQTCECSKCTSYSLAYHAFTSCSLSSSACRPKCIFDV